jgi:hypothetical protein
MREPPCRTGRPAAVYRGLKVAQRVWLLVSAVLEENCAPTSICPAVQLWRPSLYTQFFTSQRMLSFC